MNWKLTTGIALIVLGAAALVFKGITWQSRKPIIRVGTVHMDVTVHHHLMAEPLAAAAAIAGGVVLVVWSRRSAKP